MKFQIGPKPNIKKMKSDQPFNLSEYIKFQLKGALF